MFARLGEWMGRLLIGAALVGLSIGAVLGPRPVLAQTRSATLTGVKVAKVVASGRANAQTGAVATLATYTVGASDASFEIGANINVTVATTHSFNVLVGYTDETNTGRTQPMAFVIGGGSLVANPAITNANGVNVYAGLLMQIRAKAGTTITVSTSGTFTTVTYNAEGVIKQLP